MPKSTYMTGPNSTDYPRSPIVEAAKFLVSVARRFVNDRASMKEVDEAVAHWQEVRNKLENSHL